MKFILLAFLSSSLLIFSCLNSKPGEYGSVSGNVFWKYNNFVGNKPDAGSNISLYSLEDSNIVYKALTGVRGDYRFDSILAGSYLLIIESKNTTDAPYMHVTTLYNHKEDLEKLTHEKIDNYCNTLYEKIKLFENQKLNYPIENIGLKEWDKLEDSIIYYSEKILDTIPLQTRIITGIYGSYAPKADIAFIVVQKNRNISRVTDFGITYL